MTNGRQIAGKLAFDADDIAEEVNHHEISNYRKGVALIVISVGLWITGLELVNTVVKGESYRKPWLFAVVVGSLFVINFLPDLFTRCQTDADGVKQLSKKQVAWLSAQVAFVYYMYNLCVLESLQYTLASNQTVIGTTSTVFCLVIGVALGFERFLMTKLGCVLGLLCGVTLVNIGAGRNETGIPGRFSPRNPMLGNSIALCGAGFYAAYLVIMKVWCGTGDILVNERRLFGWVGLWTLVGGVPLLLLVDYLGIEPLEYPPDATTAAVVVINGISLVISDYTAVLAMLLTSPLVVSLLLTLAIPITIFIDYVIVAIANHHPQSLSSIYLVGILCMLLAVVLINVNISLENDLINDIIDDTLEHAMKIDPPRGVLSPFSPHARRHGDIIGFKHGLSPFATPKRGKAISGFNLNGDIEDHSALPNSNHVHLYTVEQGSGDGLIFTLGKNHDYHMKENRS